MTDTCYCARGWAVFWAVLGEGAGATTSMVTVPMVFCRSASGEQKGIGVAVGVEVGGAEQGGCDGQGAAQRRGKAAVAVLEKQQGGGAGLADEQIGIAVGGEEMAEGSGLHHDTLFGKVYRFFDRNRR